MGLYRDETGRLIDVDDKFAEARGYEPAAPAELGNIIGAKAEAARGEERGIVGDINAAGTGLLSGATAGLSDVVLGAGLTDQEREQLNAEIGAHPYLRGGGELAGMFLSGMEGAPRTPTGYLSSVAGKTVEQSLEQGGIAGTAKAVGTMGLEGAIQSAGQYMGQSALEDKEVTAEGLTGALGHGFAFGAVGGGAALGIAKGTMSARRMFSRVMDGKTAAKDAESAWSNAAQQSLEADQATARAAEAKLDTIRKAKAAAARERNAAKSATQEEKIRASAATAPASEADFEAGIGTDVIPREKASSFDAESKIKTEVLKRPDVGVEGPVPLDEGIAPAGMGDGGVTSIKKRPEFTPEGTKIIPRAKVEAPAESLIPKTAADIADEDAVLTVPAKDIEAHGFDSLSVPGKDRVKTDKARAAIKEGQREPIKITVSPGGRYTLEDGTHRLSAAIEAGADVKVQFFKGSKALDEVAPEGYVVKGGARTEPDFETPGKTYGDQEPNVRAKIAEMQRQGRTKESMLDEVANAPSGPKTKVLPRSTPELQAARNEALSEIRYKTTEELLGPELAKQEQRLYEVLDKYNAAKRELEPLAGAGDISDGIPREDVPNEFAGSPKTGKQSPGKRHAMEIVGDAHEEALLRARHAADPQEAGKALTEAEHLEQLLEGLSTQDMKLTNVKSLTRDELRGALGKGMAEDMMGGVDKVNRYEKAAAELAEEVGDAAHPLSSEKASAFRDAERDSERKMYDRAARAADDQNDVYGPQYKTPKERVQYARERQNEAQGKLDELTVQEKEAGHAKAAADKTVREGERAKKAALALDAKNARIASRAAAAKGGAQDLGGMLEILDIPGLPKPHDLPIIGPLLGAYLKFRTLKKAMGGFMGRIPATADARVAVLANQTRDRIARAVDRSLGLLEKAGTRGMRVIPPAAGILSQRIFDDGHPDPKKNAPIQTLAAARMREISALVSTPGAIEATVRRELVGVTDPDVIAAAEKARRLMFEYIASVMPKVPDQGLLNSAPWEPSPAEAMSFSRSLDAAGDPAGVFERLANTQGLLSLEAAETLRNVYPKLFAQAQQRLLERAAEGNLKVPLRTRVQMAVLFKLPSLEPGLDPENFTITQSVYERKPSSPAYNPAAPVGNPNTPPTAAPSIANPVNISQALTPSIDRR